MTCSQSPEPNKMLDLDLNDPRLPIKSPLRRPHPPIQTIENVERNRRLTSQEDVEVSLVP
jgi:hypothetical protein